MQVEQHLSKFFTLSSQASILLAFDGVILAANHAWQEVAGYHPDQLIGKNWLDFVEEKKILQQAFIDLQQGKTLNRIECRVLFADGIYHWMAWRGAADEEAQVIVAQAIDITLRKQAQEALAFKNKQLEKVAVQLAQMRLEAERANQVKSEFLANMSHEIRTPLNAILGINQILMDSKADEEALNYYRLQRTACNNLLSLINDILDISKIEAGQVELESIAFSPQEIVEESAELYAQTAYAKGLEIIVEFGKNLPAKVMGDPLRVRQVVSNLISNAIKYTLKGHVHIRLDIRESSAEAVHLLFSIKDTGVGIPEKIQAQIFEKFSQADTSTTRKFGGTGLGLAICRSLSGMMGGDISVQSKENEGSTFTFSLVLPLAKNEKTNIPAISLEKLHGVRILLYMPRSMSQDALRRHLTLLGVECITAENSKEFITILQSAAAEARPFPIILADAQIPDGIDEAFIRKVRRLAPIEDTRIILVTALVQRGDAQRIKELGFSAYLSKPLLPNRLHSVLLASLDHNSAETVQESRKNLDEEGTMQQISQLAEGEKIVVLLVEDMITNQMVAKVMLEGLGCVVDVANNGAEAVEKVQKKQYPVIFMDCQMPVMDGFEATRGIRALQRAHAHIGAPYIIAQTANALEGDKNACFQAGMDSYITKPLTKTALQKALLDALVANNIRP